MDNSANRAGSRIPTGDNFDQMLKESLTLALLRLSCWTEGTGELSWRGAWNGYDFDVLDALQEQGLVSFSHGSKSLQLTDNGFLAGDVLATRIAMMFMDVMDRSSAPEPIAASRPDKQNHARQSTGAGRQLSILDGGRAPGAEGTGAPARQKGDGAHDTCNPIGFDIYPSFGYVPLEAHPTFDPLVTRREPDPRVFRLRIELDLEDLHPCWREILIPAACTFLDLHVVIQRVFNWYDEHLFDFEMTSRNQKLHIEESLFIDPGQECYTPASFAIVEAAELRLGDVFPRSRVAQYSYDYGDGWEHEVRVVETIRNGNIAAPQLVDGEGDAPPEDVGGIGGFERFLRIMADPHDPEYEEMAAWAESQMAEPFDITAKKRELAECYEDDRQRWLDAVGRAKRHQ